jgi:hypothetical protein
MQVSHIDPINRTTGILNSFDSLCQESVGVSPKDIAPEQRQHFLFHYVVYVSIKYKNEVMNLNSQGTIFINR